jgi:hypothetical protein
MKLSSPYRRRDSFTKVGIPIDQSYLDSFELDSFRINPNILLWYNNSCLITGRRL